MHVRRAPAPPDPLIDAIAAQLTGQKINAGIALIDTDWAAGKSLDDTLAGLTRVARAAPPGDTPPACGP